MIRLVSNSYIQTENIAEKIAQVLKGHEIIALYGDLGAGKTCFTRGLCKALGCEENVSSPTFAIVNVYEGKFTVYHFDMYRITSVDDLYSTGYYDYIGNGIIIIEWSENIEEELKNNKIKINLRYGNNENQRFIEINGLDEYESIIC